MPSSTPNPPTLMERAHANVPLPAVVHQVASHVGADTRVIVVGDVHGCLDELQSLLVRVGYDRDADQLLLVGDLVNKGPKSAEVVRFVRESGALCVRGNHDDAALSAFYQWRASGGDMTAIALKYAYVAQLSPDDVAFLEQLPFTLSIPAHNAIVVHAGIVPGVDLREQRPVDLYKMRFLQREGSDQSDAGRWRALEKAKHAAEGSPTPLKWAPLWPGPVHVYFGHAASTGLQQEPFATGLDTGCCYGRQLTACILPEKRLVHEDAKQVYEVPSGA